MTPYPEMGQVLGLLEEALCGSAEAAGRLGELLPALLPGDRDARGLSWALGVGPEAGCDLALATAVLGALARAGVVPPGAHPDNLPAALERGVAGRL